MKEEIKVPAMGESITEATIGEIFKPTGSSVKVDEEILELETDKVNQVLYAPQSGVITIDVATDDTVTIGQVLGFVDTDGKEEKPPEPKKQEEKAPEPKKQEEKASEPKPVEKPENPARISKEAFLSETPAPETPKKPPVKIPSGQKETRKPMTRIRKVIASRLLEAQQNTAMLTTFNEVDMTQVIALRNRYKDPFLERHGIKLGFMSFFVKACVQALKANPELNSYIDGDDIVQRHTFDIGIAVGTDRGLVVPVLRNCDQMSYADIEAGIAEYAKKARKGGLKVDDLQGGGFTITNGGIYGSLLSTPILNPPQCGILGMHKIEERPIAEKGSVVIRPMMYLALSYDHRIVDGKEAVTFLVDVKESLEYPAKDLILGESDG